jgi:hypothetical protein
MRKKCNQTGIILSYELIKYEFKMGIAKQSLSFTNFCGIILLCDLCRKRHLNSSASVEQDYSASKLSESGLFYDGHNIHSPTNAALILENIKQEVESLDADYLDEKSLYSSRKRLSADIAGVPGMDDGFDSLRYSLKACKQEGDSLGDDADNIFNLFASLFDSSLTGRYCKIYVVHFPFTVKFG